MFIFLMKIYWFVSFCLIYKVITRWFFCFVFENKINLFDTELFDQHGKYFKWFKYYEIQFTKWSKMKCLFVCYTLHIHTQPSEAYPHHFQKWSHYYISQHCVMTYDPWSRLHSGVKYSGNAKKIYHPNSIVDQTPCLHSPKINYGVLDRISE